jgi:hypothetical protein
MKKPSDDSDETWHQEDDHWGWGIVCDKCERKDPIRNSPPMFNIHHLKAQNNLGMTVREMEKDIIGDRNHDEIDRVR